VGRALTILIIALWLSVPAATGFAQQLESPGPGGVPCKAGELCGSGDNADRLRNNPQPVVDPPGRYLRSLVTLGLIAALVGTYLFVALSGHTPLRRGGAGGAGDRLR
jgi:hypothetical protein